MRWSSQIIYRWRLTIPSCTELLPCYPKLIQFVMREKHGIVDRSLRGYPEVTKTFWTPIIHECSLRTNNLICTKNYTLLKCVLKHFCSKIKVFYQNIGHWYVHIPWLNLNCCVKNSLWPQKSKANWLWII